MARTSNVARLLPLAATLAVAAACADTNSVPRPPERGDGGAPTQTVDQSLRGWQARQPNTNPELSPDIMRRIDPGNPGRSAPGVPGNPYAGTSSGLPSIPMRPDATTIPLPGRTTFPLPGGTTLPTAADPSNPNNVTTVPRPN
ncbi:hypothetical protein FHP25_39690 [Vineibacter terrae]|uniref:Lipoprotein n=1 Tax=Vineibacter terrae TaxID=2586908 RepID=A0A5C8P7I0_9HYPH|nr:hypothetical protein [Vineibacter terrae]TXL69290.1 hypothetical protein FHP25_39690 [Vineibacter terrae]